MAAIDDLAPLPPEFSIVPECYKCTICLEIMIDAVMINNAQSAVEDPCGHLFCRECIMQHLASSPSLSSTRKKNITCPSCRRPCSEELLVADMRTRREIADLIVPCSFKDQGCSWHGVHGLNEAVDGLQRHLKRCKFRGTQCTHCQKMVCADDDADHKLNCDMMPTVCSVDSRCKKLIAPRDMEKHLDSECRYRPACCPTWEVLSQFEWNQGVRSQEFAACKRVKVHSQLASHESKHVDLHLKALWMTCQLALDQKKLADAEKQTLETQVDLLCMRRPVKATSSSSTTSIDTSVWRKRRAETVKDSDVKRPRRELICLDSDDDDCVL